MVCQHTRMVRMVTIIHSSAGSTQHYQVGPTKGLGVAHKWMMVTILGWIFSFD